MTTNIAPQTRAANPGIQRIVYLLVTNIYLPGEAIGGIEAHMITLAQGVNRTGAATLAILPDSPIFDPVERDMRASGSSVKRLRPIKTKPLTALPGAVLQLAATIRGFNADLVHIHRSVPSQGKWGIVAARLAGAQVVATDHGYPAKVGTLGRIANSLTDIMIKRVIVVSNYSRQRQINEVGRSAALVRTVYNGIDIAHFTPVTPDQRRAARAQFGLPNDATVIGLVSRLEPIKGISTLVAAAAHLIPKWTNLHVLIAGDGSQRQPLQAQALQLGIADKVHFPGAIPDAADAFRALDLFVFPTRWESFGLVAAEAMAMGIPVVTTRVAALPEVVSDGETGLLVPADDPPALASAIERLLASPELRSHMVLAGRRRVEQAFSTEVMVDEMVRLYKG